MDRFAVPYFGKSHFVHGQSTSFVGTDVVGPSHSLAGVHLADQVLVIEHLLD